ncbi:general secretion pathway protein GspE [Corallococcus aberystwythensis]|uniref:General secretion pathway protein GspE n=1 Tax=Corallococcus aberystwythensis TaxID=2316722 RepID=A0A3A8Q1L1_9BACT|nr:general secretion pathway protein GspE [Corallococcus aberystwythensis]RKH61948.1 general secretion pathway protein GspE [Corallococcus aberystwythensis]
MARKRIGELLVERGAISPAQLEAGLAAQRQTRQRLGVTLIGQGAITEATLAQALSEALEMPQVDLAAITPDWAAVHFLRARFCEQHDLFPYALETVGGRRQLVVAMADPLNITAIEEIEFTSGMKVSGRVTALSAVRGAILRYYHKVPVATGPRAAPARPPARAAPPPARPAVVDDDEEVIVGEELPAAEKTQRTSLADLIREREEQAKRKRSGAAAGPGDKAKAKAPASGGGVLDDLDYLFGQAAREEPDRLEELERRFWALMRIMARKGLLTNEEFRRELDDEGGEG